MLFNHWIFTIKTQPVENSLHMRIVGFEVEPRSYAPGEEVRMDWKSHKNLYLEDLGENTRFQFTYSIKSVVDMETEWNMRMDN